MTAFASIAADQVCVRGIILSEAILSFILVQKYLQLNSVFPTIYPFSDCGPCLIKEKLITGRLCDL